MVANGMLEPLVTADLDLVNMVGNAEWPCIRQALHTHFPGTSAWTECSINLNRHFSLPTGATFATNWGAEQGDVLDTIQVRWSWSKRATRISASSSPTLSRPVRPTLVVRLTAPRLGRPRLHWGLPRLHSARRASALSARGQVRVCGGAKRLSCMTRDTVDVLGPDSGHVFWLP